MTGTTRYASINIHMGIEPSRRDDLTSIGYMLVYFIRGGKLPWQSLKISNRAERNNLVMNSKMTTSIELLCNGFPSAFALYLNYCGSLHFEDRPDYAYVRSLFKQLSMSEAYTNDDVFDWSIFGSLSTSATASLSGTQSGGGVAVKGASGEGERIAAFPKPCSPPADLAPKSCDARAGSTANRSMRKRIFRVSSNRTGSDASGITNTANECSEVSSRHLGSEGQRHASLNSHDDDDKPPNKPRCLPRLFRFGGKCSATQG